MSAQILLVDDDRSLVDLVSLALEDVGFTVRTALDGAAGWRAFSEQPPDLAILDLVMPELDGLELCRRIRGASATPVIMLTSRGDEVDRVLGLELGADDYVTKPFSTRELVARVRALLRRVRLDRDPEGDSAERRLGSLWLSQDRREVQAAGQVVTLTATEFDLLWALCGRPGVVLSRDELIDVVYGPQVLVAHRTVDTFVKRLRHKLAAANPGFTGIETVRGVGYRIKA